MWTKITKYWFLSSIFYFKNHSFCPLFLESFIRGISYNVDIFDNINFWTLRQLHVPPNMKMSFSLLKVSKFQNEFMKSSVSPKIWTKSCTVPHYREEILTIFGSYFGRNDDFISSVWNLLTFSRHQTQFCNLWSFVFLATTYCTFPNNCTGKTTYFK